MTNRILRGTGLLVINARLSNPNGDPDSESDPRTLTDGRGLISPVSFKRKLRDLVADAEGPVFFEAAQALGLPKNGVDGNAFEILESRGRDRVEISKLSEAEFKRRYWDARVFGATFLEEKEKGAKSKAKTKGGDEEEEQSAGRSKEGFINAGVVQFGPGVSLAPVEIVRCTNTNKAGVQTDKSRGMAPLAFRVVEHGLYVMPFYVNAAAARRTGCTAQDIDLLRFLVPHAYAQTLSAIRPDVSLIHAWYAMHKSPLGSCPDIRLIEALTPRRKAGFPGMEPSKDAGEYEIPAGLPKELEDRLSVIEDLCVKQWT